MHNGPRPPPRVAARLGGRAWHRQRPRTRRGRWRRRSRGAGAGGGHRQPLEPPRHRALRQPHRLGRGRHPRHRRGDGGRRAAPTAAEHQRHQRGARLALERRHQLQRRRHREPARHRQRLHAHPGGRAAHRLQRHSRRRHGRLHHPAAHGRAHRNPARRLVRRLWIRSGRRRRQHHHQEGLPGNGRDAELRASAKERLRRNHRGRLHRLRLGWRPRDSGLRVLQRLGAGRLGTQFHRELQPRRPQQPEERPARPADARVHVVFRRLLQ